MPRYVDDENGETFKVEDVTFIQGLLGNQELVVSDKEGNSATIINTGGEAKEEECIEEGIGKVKFNRQD